MRDFALGVTGIVVSVLTFILGYRQTIGARQERLRSLDRTVTNTLLKRLILADKELTWTDVEREVAGKAVEARIAATALRQPESIVDYLYSAVLESDLISSADRERALGTLNDLKANALPLSVKRQLDLAAAARIRSRQATTAVAALSTAAGLAGLAVAALGPNSTRSTSMQWMTPLTFATVIVVLLIAGLAWARRSSLPRVTAISAPRALRRSTADPRVRELTSYPPEDEGREALKQLQQLSPFAIRNLYQLGLDEMTSRLRRQVVGLSAGDRELGIGELEAARYVTRESPPPGFEFREDQHWYRLTDSGRQVARLLIPDTASPNETPDPPEYLAGFAGTRTSKTSGEARPRSAARRRNAR